MKFVCSINTEVSKHVNTNTGKIESGGNFSVFNTGWTEQFLDAQSIAEYMSMRSGLCAWHLKEGKREKNNTLVLQAGLIVIDIDNQADGKGPNGEKIQKQELTFDEALDLDICKKYLSVAYDSPSGTKEWPRFRLVFGLEKPIIDADFYQWFLKTICLSIPGADIRATTVPNLFYGANGPEGILLTTDKFIPSSKIDEAYIAYSKTPKKENTKDVNSEEILKASPTKDTGLDIVRLCSRIVKSVLDGDPVEDRSATMAKILKELIGWANWLTAQGIACSVSPLTIAHDCFYSIYSYPYDCDNKFTRILDSIKEADELLPAIALASENGAAACWKKVSSQDFDLFNKLAPEEDKEQLRKSRPSPKNSVLSLDSFNLENKTTTSTSTSTKPMSTPKTPTELINLQSNNADEQGGQQRQFAENDVADIIVTNCGKDFIYDSNLDKFYTYDNDQGVWYSQDEQHIKRRVTNALDSLVKAGVLPKYNSAYVESVYKILKSKLLRSLEGGRKSIWSTARAYIPFLNGVFDSKTMEFKPGHHKDLYLRSKLAFDYDPDAKCPEFLNWLKSSLNPGNELLIQAFARALLTGYTAGERFLHLVGPGGTGKSTMQQLMIALAGFTQTHTSSLEIIETNKFETYNLMGKRLLLLTDESNYNKRMDVLKKLTSASDTLRAERKYGKEMIQFKPECLVCIASNEHITSNDSTSGLERRRLTIVMDKVVPPSKRKQLLDVYEDRIDGVFVPEMSGIVSWALSLSYETMRDILANPVKHVPAIASTNLEALVFNNQFVAWMAECCLYAPNTATKIGRGAFKPSADEAERGLFNKDAHTELYASYSNYCRSCGYRPCTKPRFVERVKETLVNILKLPSCKLVIKEGVQAVQGLRLKKYDLTSDRASLGDTRLPTPVEFAENPDFTLWEKAFKKHDSN